VPAAGVPANIALQTHRLRMLQKRSVVFDINNVRIIRAAAYSARGDSSGVVVLDEVINAELDISPFIETKIIDASCLHIAGNFAKAVLNAALDEHPIMLKLHGLIAFGDPDRPPIAILQAVCLDRLVANAGKPFGNRAEPIVVIFAMRIRIDKYPYNEISLRFRTTEAV
jgi:hypothetical protein